MSTHLRTGAQNLPALLACRDVLEFATVEGVRCTGLEHKVGTLTPGKDADIVLLKADRLNVWPLNNAPGEMTRSSLARLAQAGTLCSAVASSKNPSCDS
jgi:cytosine/adenosine deaminase-related metal-dependent hydrolase